MTVFDTVSTQMRQLGAPLFSVSLSAVPRPDTPVLLMLHWHGFHQEARGSGTSPPAITDQTASTLPSSALQLGLRWLDLAHVEQQVLEAAWQLGAWNLDRLERRGCNQVGASPREALECRQAFGAFPGQRAAQALIEDAPDREDLLQLAARVGYVSWQFRPVAGGLWPASGGDDTLDEQGFRSLPCPVHPVACRGGKTSRMVYRLGQVNGVIR